MNAVTIRQYQDEHEIIQLLDTVFNGWPSFDLHCTDLEHWEWKFKDNPLKRNMTTVTEHDNQIIGVMESIYLKFKIGSRIYLGRVGYDNAIHPEYQGKGIYSKLNEFRRALPEYNESEISVNATTNQKVIAYYTKRWGVVSFPKKIYKYVRILNIRKEVENQPLIKKIKNIFGLYFLNTINKIDIYFNRIKKSEEIDIIEVTEFSEEIIPFIDKMYKKHDFIYARSLEYLNWRYCDIRGGDYKILLAKKGKNIMGYIVCRINKKRKETIRGYVVDLLVDPDYPEAAYVLLEEGVNYLMENKVNLVEAWIIQGHWFERVFSINRFLNSRFEIGIFLGKEEIGQDKQTVLEANPHRLHLQMGDTDWI